MSSDNQRRDGSFVIESAEVFVPVFDRPSSYEDLVKISESPGYKILVGRMNDRLALG
jgi:hypothetical protein